ncbi:MAG: cytochrome c [Burkholderiales bacterium]|jgi:cytochrome c553|nr:cytochrome c [Burkholderiales bacterium]
MAATLRVAAVLVAAAAFCCAAQAQAQDAAAGARKAVACQACRGLDGLSKMPEAPHLAGQPQLYLERSLRAYRSGERRNEVMGVAAKGLSDADIRDLAAYYAAIEINVKAP